VIPGDPLRAGLYLGVWVCAALVIFNLSRLRKRGNAAFAMAGASLALGVTIMAFAESWPEPVVWAGGALTAGLLVLDGYLRAGASK